MLTFGDVIFGFGFLCFIEGLIHFAWPSGNKDTRILIDSIPDNQKSALGFLVALVGVGLIYMSKIFVL